MPNSLHLNKPPEKPTSQGMLIALCFNLPVSIDQQTRNTLAPTGIQIPRQSVGPYKFSFRISAFENLRKTTRHLDSEFWTLFMVIPSDSESLIALPIHV
mmetsp:Transcript_14647/g.23844  ORF Transcript_14647/g.23844 Transcript_14647/m.23844 type:complete len:99 (+) Transcript_14647:481-777(+)